MEARLITQVFVGYTGLTMEKDTVQAAFKVEPFL